MFSGLHYFSYNFNVSITIFKSNTEVIRIREHQFENPVEIAVYVLFDKNFIVYRLDEEMDLEYSRPRVQSELTADHKLFFRDISNFLLNFINEKSPKLITSLEKNRFQNLCSEISSKREFFNPEE
jgi:hypothetical protein